MEAISAFFNPKSVAVVGATEKPGIGRTVISNLVTETEFAGAVWPVNPTRDCVLGQRCYATLEACPGVPELVVVVTPAKTVPALVGRCVDLGVRGVVVISSGFKEVGPAGQALEDEIAAHVARSGGRTRVVGPNCFGVMCSWSHLNATFAAQICTPGRVAMISQSGAMVACILDWAMQQGLGFSSFVSVGSMLDVAWADVLEYYARDDHVSAIMIYAETLGNARAFLEAARRVSLVKPIMLLKAGRTAAAAKAAVSHTGSLAGADDVVDAALDRAGVIRVDTALQLFQLGEVASSCPIPRGPRMVVLSHAGGPGVIASDALAMGGGVLADVPKDVIARLDPQMPRHWSMSNPMDITGGATADMYGKCLDELGQVDEVDGILVFVGPLSICPPTPVAATIKAFAQRNPTKTVIGCFLGGDDTEGARRLLRRNGVPAFTFSDDAASAFATLWRYRDHLNKLYVAPEPTVALPAPELLRSAAEKVNALIAKVRDCGRTVLTEAESKELLRLYGIPVSETVPARTEDEAVAAAERLGFPVVVKLLSETITHKSDVGGVVLNLTAADQVRKAFADIRGRIEKIHPGELAKHFLGVTVQPMLDINEGHEVLLGASSDPQFGPVIVFGTGGRLVEVYRDRALALPPLTRASARDLMARTRIHKALLGTRGQAAVDLPRLESTIVAFGDLLAYHPLIKELDINPLFCSPSRICAIDARVVVWPKDCDASKIPHVAVAPYPLEHVTGDETLKLAVRPLRPEDSAAWAAWRSALPVPLNDANDARRIEDLYTEYTRQLFIGAISTADGSIRACVRISRCSDAAVHTATFALLASDAAIKGDVAVPVLLKASVGIALAEGISELHVPDDAALQPGIDKHYEAAGFKATTEGHLVLKF